MWPNSRWYQNIFCTQCHTRLSKKPGAGLTWEMTSSLEVEIHLIDLMSVAYSIIWTLAGPMWKRGKGPYDKVNTHPRECIINYYSRFTIQTNENVEFTFREGASKWTTDRRLLTKSGMKKKNTVIDEVTCFFVICK